MKWLIIGIALGIYALILWIVIYFVFRRGYREWKRNQASRPAEFAARVMDKRASSGGDERFITFEYRNRQVELRVEPSVYDSIRIGQEGILTLVGGEFQGFIPRSASDQADEIYRRMVKD